MRQFPQMRRKPIQNSRSRARRRGRLFARNRDQLLPERQVLQDQLSMPTESQRQRTTDKDQQLEHDSILAGAGTENQLGRVLARVTSVMRRSSGQGTSMRARPVASVRIPSRLTIRRPAP